MVKWVHFVTFIGIAILISCEAKSPRRRATDDSKGGKNKGGCDKYPTCGVNEVYDICPRLCPPRRCDVDERIIRCGENPKPGDPKCKPGCRCADNYYRNNDGVCVTKDECPKCFLKNEVFECQSSDPQTCETIDEEQGPIRKNKHCKRECRCKKGFYRNKIGECISKKNCLKCNGPNEYFTCGSACDNVCDNIHLQNQTNCPIINIDCNPKCYCEYGYARDHNNICVPIAECPPKCNRPNEVSECQNPCPQTCETIGEKCFSTHIAKRDCKRECRCKKGYYRNKLGDCISEENCLKCTGPHEFFSCGSACDNVCATLNSQNQTNCPIINIVCNQMCYCEEGYARDDNNICVPIADCPLTCGVNEVYDICPRLCPPRRCGVDERLIKCAKNPEPGDPKCKPGCRCADNYYRNNDGICVTKNKCPKCTRKNEVYACRSSNPQTCESIDEDYGPLKRTKRCKRECRCKAGYYKNKIGECISKENCLKCNGPHEYFTCGSACDNVCATLHLQNQTNCPIKNKICNQKCYCEEGYARDENNICVPFAECLPVCKENEVYDICPSFCPPRRCDVDERLIKCRPYPLPGNPECQPGCRCADNFYRNELGLCVTRDECPPFIKCGENEYPSRCANGGCKRESCAFPAVVCAKLLPGSCEEGCLCKENYLRADNGTCIPEDECPSAVCGINEVYDICPPACPPQRCGVNVAAISCIPNPMPGDPNCNPGCRCADDHVRNDAGVCIPRNECPPEPTCGDNEELSNCANGGCRRWKCSDEGIICKDLFDGSCVKDCVCKEFYTRADDGRCVPVDQCPPVCGINEVYDICPPICPPLRCDVNIAAISCKPSPKPGDPECNPGCRCADNHVRNDAGICIPRDECPPEPICGDNEEPSDCAYGGCRRWKCSDEGTICRDLTEESCVKGCVCIDSYVRADNGTCIPQDQCPEPIQCGMNEQYSTCANGGCRRFSCAESGILCVDLIEGGCNPGCICIDSYTRADNGTCIPEDQCPPVCNENEVYDICPALCPPRTCDVDERTIDCAPPPLPGDPECNPGCRCAENYYKNDLGVCVTREECPPLIKCGTNEIASRCANGGGCRKLSCAVPVTVCAKIPNSLCEEGCLCKENYLRADNGTCVPESECPPVCGANEIYDVCPPTCPPQRCDVDNRLIKCKRTPTPGDPECKPGCRCEDNYYRNNLGVCVTREECPPLIQCGENEYPSSCANGGCRKVSCARPQIRCVKLREGGCKEGCLCNDNYLRAENGTCIPEEKCPPVCGINEVYDICPPTCPQQRCDVDIAVILCKPNPEPGDPECKPGCRCADNYFKNSEEICVPRDECPKEPICGKNEELSDCANGGCKRWKCSDEVAICKDLKSGTCEKGCICKESYVRADDGTCIPENQCPPPPIDCGLNEEYSTCANGGCRRYNCNMTAILCIDLVEGACKPGCICKETYTRADNGSCIPEDQCPQICGPNEEYGCDNTCTKTCNIVDGKCVPPMKTKICKLQCHCKDGYKRNNERKCVEVGYNTIVSLGTFSEEEES